MKFEFRDFDERPPCATRKHTNLADVCYELFSGSAGRLGRRVYTMETKPFFMDISIPRYCEATGKQSVLERDGRTCGEVEAGPR